MEKQIIAYCGLICTECEAYTATQANDVAALMELAEKSSEFIGHTLTWEENQCDGCLSDGRQIGYCSQCAVRKCAVEHAVENCAYCPEYGCDTLLTFFEMAPSASITLENIRKSLKF